MHELIDHAAVLIVYIVASALGQVGIGVSLRHKAVHGFGPCVVEGEVWHHAGGDGLVRKPNTPNWAPAATDGVGEKPRRLG